MKKKCTRCKEAKSIEDFNKNKHLKGGHDRYCKICANAALRKSDKVNHEIQNFSLGRI